MKFMLEKPGYEVKPLGSKSSLKGVPLEKGGGYRATFGGDGYFQYHPEKAVITKKPIGEFQMEREEITGMIRTETKNLNERQSEIKSYIETRFKKIYPFEEIENKLFFYYRTALKCTFFL